MDNLAGLGFGTLGSLDTGRLMLNPLGDHERVLMPSPNRYRLWKISTTDLGFPDRDTDEDHSAQTVCDLLHHGSTNNGFGATGPAHSAAV